LFFLRIALAAQAFSPCPEGAMVAVVKVALVGVGLALEGDGEIGALGTAGGDEADGPLYAVPYIEAQPQELALLQGMDILMVALHLAQRAAAQHQSKQIDGYVAAKGEYIVEENFQLLEI